MYLLFYRLGSKVTTLRDEDEEEADEDLAETDEGAPTHWVEILISGEK